MAGGHILIGRGKGGAEARLDLRYANRHGLIAGATGTGKTVTLQTLAEGFSAAGVPVFLADVKGDLSGLSQPGRPHPKLEARAGELGLALDYRGVPTLYWDLLGEQGHPIRTTVSEMGPVLLARLLNLNDTQAGVLTVAFRAADDNGLLLLDLKDLRALLSFVADNAGELSTRYGNVTKASVGAIQRQLLELESQGGDRFFGEPSLELADIMRIGPDGRGYVSVLAADRLMNSAPKLYATFLLWLLAELFEELPEMGDVEKPRLVFVFDEAHLLFDDAPPALVDQVERVVRLIRSKGVGVYFVTKNPLDLPETVLGQLGNRVQHALRAFTPRDQKAVRAAAETFRPNPAIDTGKAITELGVGEALVSTLDAQGTPTPVERVFVRPPEARLGPATAEERAALLRSSPVAGRYDQAIDRQSAHEVLTRKMEAPPPFPGPRGGEPLPPAGSDPGQGPDSPWGGLGGTLWGQEPAKPARGKSAGSRRQTDSFGEALAKSVARSVGSSVGQRLGKELVRGVLGALFRGR